MPHRQIAVALVVILSFWTISRERAKRLVRAALVQVNRGLLGLSSRAYQPREGLTVVFAPHQDDESLGCGGLIAHRRYEGWPVHVIFLTNGGGSHRNHPWLTAPEVIAWRRREAGAALRELGVESCAVHYLDEPDGSLGTIAPDRAAALTERLRLLLGELRPTEVFLPCCPDGSSEHDAAYGLITRAVLTSGVKPILWQYPIWSWWNPLLLLRHTLTARRRVRLPTADFTQSKRTAIAGYASQTKPTPPWKEAVIPADLLATLQGDTEYFFEHETPPPHEPAAEI